MELELYKLETEDGMEAAILQYKNNLVRISAGNANPAILSVVKVDYYGSLTPISQISNISIPEPRQLLIKPFDISTTRAIVVAINNASLGFNAVDEGDKARITIPALTTERRKELVKSLSKYTEQAKVKVRSIRQDINKQIKDDDELTEDEEKSFLEAIQHLTDKYIKIVDELTDVKEKDLMTL